MVTAEYRITGNIGEWQSVIGRGRTVEFIFGEGTEGVLFFGGKSATLAGGRCIISTAGLPFGEYAPRLEGAKGVVQLEPLTVAGERIVPAPTGDAIHRYVLERLLATESKIKTLEERIDELYSLVKGTALFG